MRELHNDKEPSEIVTLQQAPSHEGPTKYTKHVKRNQTSGPSEKGLDPNLGT